jgi:hypothetical protein
MLPVEGQQLTYINPLAVDDSTTSAVNLDIESVRRSLDNALMGIDNEGG